MTDLIERLETAESGSRELSDEVLLALDWTYALKSSAITGSGGGDIEMWHSPAGLMHHGPRPSPAESVDDALSLVPDGYWLTLQRSKSVGHPPQCHAKLYGDADTLDRDMEDWEEYEYVANNFATPALALCAAILRAHEMEKG